ncbi:MAG: S1 RNA-binding domain-containing protein, partial [Calditrichaeota bacterium]
MAHEDTFGEAVEKNLQVYTPKIGDQITGTIIAINDAAIVLDCGAKSEAIMDPQELETPQVGDRIDVMVVETEPTFKVSTKISGKSASSSQLQSAFEAGMPVSGKIVEKVNAGFRVEIGGERAFLPMGKLALEPVENPDEYLGKTFDFTILEYNPAENKFVVSRLDILKKQESEKLADVWAKLKPGAVITGVVRSMQNFGAFVDVGGVEGLVHISEVSETFIHHPSEVLKIGQEVQVKVLSADQEKNRISLSMKSIHSELWEEFAQKVKIGDAFTGKITRKTDFGLFVEVAPGIEGLLHISQIRLGGQLEDSDYEAGKEISGWIRSLDAEHRRLQLTQRELPAEDPWEKISTRLKKGDLVEAKIDGMTKFG